MHFVYTTISVKYSGFEAGGQNTPSLFDPWAMVGSSKQVTVGTERSSPFERNPIALKVQVLCDPSDATNACPASGAGVSNPGFWGMVSGPSLSHINSNIFCNGVFMILFFLESWKSDTSLL